MKNIRCEWKGTSPLIMHSCRGVNLLDPLVVEMRNLTKKRSKTDDDLQKIADMEWELGLYYDEAVGLYVPAENIERAMQEGGKARKRGADFAKGFNCLDMMVPLDIGEKRTLDELRRDRRFRDTRAMRVMSARVNRTRPRFNMWRLIFTAAYDETILSLDAVATAMEHTGGYVGIGDSRTRKYGRFVCSITELD